MRVRHHILFYSRYHIDLGLPILMPTELYYKTFYRFPEDIVHGNEEWIRVTYFDLRYSLRWLFIPTEFEFHLYLARARIIRHHIIELRKALHLQPLPPSMSYYILKMISDQQWKLDRTMKILNKHFNPN